MLSSTIARLLLIEAQHMTHRSWLKLLRMTKRPASTSPSRLLSGTTQSLKVMYAVPAAVEYDVLICLVSTPSDRGTRNTVNPPSVLAPTV